jgi:hypothetical protein
MSAVTQRPRKTKFAFNPKPAVRTQKNLLLGVYGKHGTGKTLLALRLATRLKGSGDILLIDSERDRPSDYAPSQIDGRDGIPHDKVTADSYTIPYLMEMLDQAMANNYTVVVVDSFTPWWSGKDGLSDLHAALAAQKGNGYNKYNAWGVVNRAEAELYDKMTYFVWHHGHLLFLMEEKNENNEDMQVIGEAPNFRATFPYKLDFLLQTVAAPPGRNIEQEKAGTHYVRIRKNTATQLTLNDDGTDVSVKPLLETNSIIVSKDNLFLDEVLAHLQSGQPRPDYSAEAAAVLDTYAALEVTELRNRWSAITAEINAKEWPRVLKDQVTADLKEIGLAKGPFSHLDTGSSEEEWEDAIQGCATLADLKELNNRAHAVGMLQAYTGKIGKRKKELESAESGEGGEPGPE